LTTQHEYLMTAMLAVAARHLSILNPHSRRHHNAALSLISKSCSQFRSNLDYAITLENRDARLATSILLHYLAWCNVEPLALEAASASGSAVDLSRDQLFLLSEGVRQVRVSSWRLPRIHESVFGRLVFECCYSRYGALRAVVSERAAGHRARRACILALHDDPRFRRATADVGTGGGSLCPPGDIPRLDLLVANDNNTVTCMPESHPHVSPDNRHLSLSALFNPPETIASLSPVEREAYSRLAFAVVADRVATLLHASQLAAGSELDQVTREELERSFLTFPILCYRPFCDLVAEGDSRALAVLYLVYKSGRAIMGASGAPWWAARRSEIMEVALEKELERRGLLEALREYEVSDGDVDDDGVY
jgi:hypothetical protein